MGRLRRIGSIALEDFGLRARRRAAPTDEAPVQVLPPGIVWQGAAARRPELQRFIDDLASKRVVEPAGR